MELVHVGSGFMERGDKENDKLTSRENADSSTVESVSDADASAMQHLSVAGTRTMPPLGRVKRPKSAWQLFCSDQRAALSKEDCSTGALITKIVGEKYRQLTEEEKLTLKKRAEEEKERYFVQIMEREALLRRYQTVGWLSNPCSNPNLRLDPNPKITTGSSDAFAATSLIAPNAAKLSASKGIFPVARMKRIVSLDSDVKHVSTESLELLIQATELFIGQLARDSLTVTRTAGRKSIRAEDIVQCIYTRANLNFLQMDFPRDLQLGTKNKTQIKSRPNLQPMPSEPEATASLHQLLLGKFEEEQSGTDEHHLSPDEDESWTKPADAEPVSKNHDG